MRYEEVGNSRQVWDWKHSLPMSGWILQYAYDEKLGLAIRAHVVRGETYTRVVRSDGWVTSWHNRNTIEDAEIPDKIKEKMLTYMALMVMGYDKENNLLRAETTKLLSLTPPVISIPAEGINLRGIREASSIHNEDEDRKNPGSNTMGREISPEEASQEYISTLPVTSYRVLGERTEE